MATRRRKITRSAVRRVKRRESKNAKLRSLRVRKHSSKRMNMRKMNGGADPDDFFRIYSVECIVGDPVMDKYSGILFYNHKTRYFHLFTYYLYGTDLVFELVKGLCGLNIKEGFKHNLGLGNSNNIGKRIQYYHKFQKSSVLRNNNLYAMHSVPGKTEYIPEDPNDDDDNGGTKWIKPTFHITNIPQTEKAIPPIITLDKTKDSQDFTLGEGIKFTFEKIIPDSEAMTDKNYDIITLKNIPDALINNEALIHNAWVAASHVLEKVDELKEKKAAEEALKPENIEKRRLEAEENQKRDEARKQKYSDDYAAARAGQHGQ